MVICRCANVASGKIPDILPRHTCLAVAAALITSVYCLAVVIPTTYARPPVVAALPNDAIPLDVACPEGLGLLAVRV